MTNELIDSYKSTNSKTFKRILVIGSQGAIGNAFVDYYSQHQNYRVYAISRFCQKSLNTKDAKDSINDNVIRYYINYSDEEILKKTINQITSEGKLDLVILATGFLQNDDIKPEKSVDDISLKNFEYVFYVNTFLPALLIKYLLPHLNTNNPSFFVALSARVGSISDNKLGGWYGYRASKAALNMLIKSASIELKRINKKGIIVGLHPGTVYSDLSKPFVKNKSHSNIFSPNQSVYHLDKVINQLNNDDSGKCFAWDGKEILP